MSKKIILIIFLALVIIGGFIFFVNSKMEYNDEFARGNTTGNLYNQGLFCEYDDEVYFSNPLDKNALYKMNMDGSEFEKLYDDSTSYINIYNDYIYYKKFNTAENEDILFSRTFYGIGRIGTNGGKSEIIHQGMIDSMALVGNYIYYRYYDNKTLYSLYKVKIDGENDKKITDEDYLPLSISGTKIYFSNIKNNHNLMELDTKNDKITTIATGNFYLPDVNNGYIYYIDMGNGRKLTRILMSTGKKEILSNDTVINYNLSGKYNVIYYQAENSTDEHMLLRIDQDGKNRIIIAYGDYTKINITKKYTYFYKITGKVETLMRTLTTGFPDVSTFIPEVID